MFEDDETRRLGAGDPLLQVSGDASRGDTGGLAQLPVVGVLVPVDLDEAKDVLSDSADTVVRVSIRWPPELGNASTSDVRDDLHGVTELGNGFGVGKTGHVAMSPGVHGKVISVREGCLGVGREALDLFANEKVGRLDVLSLKEVVKLWAVLGWSIIERNSQHSIRRVPNIPVSSALIS